MIGLQTEAGYWLFELEADCTIPAEYIMMMHFLDEIDARCRRRSPPICALIRPSTAAGRCITAATWISAAGVKAYYALKLAGDDPDAPHMARARAAISKRGGAARSNVFTRIALAQFEQVPWRGVPYIPVEIMLLPRWFPFHIDRVSYWSRTVMVPLFILCSTNRARQNPRGVDIRELFTTPPEQERHYFHLPPIATAGSPSVPDCSIASGAPSTR